MDRFLAFDDELGQRINTGAQELLSRLQKLDIDKLNIPEYCKIYFRGSHADRLFFSIETSAGILYRSLKMLKMQPADVVVMDYGAGVGTLFMLAKMIGCKKVIYNDHLPDWRESAQTMAHALNIDVDEYIEGDIEKTLIELAGKNILCDLVTSRNVIEHIYDLKKFFAIIHRYLPGVLVFSSTTANIYNPASKIKHLLWHRKWEKIYTEQRRKLLRDKYPSLSAQDIQKLVPALRGLATEDFDMAVNNFIATKALPDPSKHRSNTCDCLTGVWAEHLLYFNEYKELIDPTQYELKFEPGFWDTHYVGNWKNAGTAYLNKMIKNGGRTAFRLAPFIYVIAKSRGKDGHGKY